MKPLQERTAGRLVGLLNGDILRELHMADTCLRQAACLPLSEYPVVRGQVAVCAAIALRNATALAVEVLALGGRPPIPRRLRRRPVSDAVGSYPGKARKILAHYRRRLHMAERLGLSRLREVFREIVTAKEHHLAHEGLIQTHGPAARHICS